MANPNSRDDLKEYVLRALGYPVININVAADQLEDRLDDSINYIHELHMDGSEKTYLKHQITSTQILIDETLAADTFAPGTNISGQTSAAYATVEKQADDGKSIYVYRIYGEFLEGETLVGTTGTATISDTADVVNIILGDIDRQYIDIPASCLSVLQIFPVSFLSTSNYLFDPQYHLINQVMMNFSAQSLNYYQTTRQYINQVHELLVGQKPIGFNRHNQKLKVYWDWKRAVTPGQYVIIECYSFIDETTFHSFYNNRMLKDLAVANAGIQWGRNLSKFGGIQLPGGTTLSGSDILAEYTKMKTETIVEIDTKYTAPNKFFVG